MFIELMNRKPRAAKLIGLHKYNPWWSPSVKPISMNPARPRDDMLNGLNRTVYADSREAKTLGVKRKEQVGDRNFRGDSNV